MCWMVGCEFERNTTSESFKTTSEYSEGSRDLRNQTLDAVFPGFAVIDNEIFHLPIFHHHSQAVWIHEHGLEKFDIGNLIEFDTKFMLIIECSTALKDDPLIRQFELTSNGNKIVKVAGAFFEQYIFT